MRALDDERLRALASALGAVDVAAADIRACTDDWLVFAQPRFAGPATYHRAMRLDDESTWEARDVLQPPPLPRQPTACRRIFEIPEELDDDDSEAIFDWDDEQSPPQPGFFVTSSVAGASLGEIVDASAEQRARLDGAVAAHILASVTPAFLEHEGDAAHAPAISEDHVLVGFDGAVVARGRLPWWGPRRRSRLPPGFLTRTTLAESRRLLGELAVVVFTTRRWTAKPSLSLPGLSKGLRESARGLLDHLLEAGVVPDVEDIWDASPSPPPSLVPADTIRARVEQLRELAGPVDAMLIGSIVKGLFPERWEREQRVRQALEDLRA